jgi:glutathione S-transferase
MTAMQAAVRREEGNLTLMPRVCYAPRTRSNRVLWLLEEIGRPYEMTRIPMEERGSEAHLARHPLGRVPALELDDGTLMFESAAICLQLADLAPSQRLRARSAKHCDHVRSHILPRRG